MIMDMEKKLNSSWFNRRATALDQICTLTTSHYWDWLVHIDVSNKYRVSQLLPVGWLLNWVWSLENEIVALQPVAITLRAIRCVHLNCLVRLSLRDGPPGAVGDPLVALASANHSVDCDIFGCDWAALRSTWQILPWAHESASTPRFILAQVYQGEFPSLVGASE